jgi:C-terminal processing protease CtpA/Prc
VGEFFTADGISLAPKGIHPDVFAKDNPRTKPDEGLRRALEVLAAKASAQGSGSRAGAKSKSP